MEDSGHSVCKQAHGYESSYPQSFLSMHCRGGIYPRSSHITTLYYTVLYCRECSTEPTITQVAEAGADCSKVTGRRGLEWHQDSAGEGDNRWSKQDSSRGVFRLGWDCSLLDQKSIWFCICGFSLDYIVCNTGWCLLTFPNAHSLLQLDCKIACSCTFLFCQFDI